MADEKELHGVSQGPATDRQNAPVVDPTENVLNLVGAAIRRQDDLREAHTKHVEKLDEVREYYRQEIREAEAKRIDAIRAVDVNAAQQQVSVAEIRASALASQVAAAAEAQRNQVSAAATAFEQRLNQALAPIQEAVADLRRVQYEQQGQRAQVVESRGAGEENRSQATLIMGIVLGVVTLIMAGVALYALSQEPAVIPAAMIALRPL